ncbi:MAG: hypothetical protein J0H96_14035, partial [Microbacterium ginsengisoli]|nr:hypothetical protein [Microbacterium ginsengisoli]
RLARNDREHDPRLLLRRDHRRPSHQQPPGISDADHALTTGLPEILTRDNGAAALVIMSDIRARELGITPLARIISTGVSALSPEIMGLGPVQATQRALSNAGLSIDDIDLFEINEAFAVQVLASARELGIDESRLNVSGGAIALGHPFGMTGARIATTLINNLQTHDKQFGVETMCVGGGQGMAMVIERLK